MNFFEIFGLAPNFIVDKNSIEKKYLELQIQHHPDNNQDVYIQIVVELNQAYKTLLDDLLRAEYLLALYQMKITDYEVKTNQVILLQALEDREQLEELSEADDMHKFLNAKNREQVELNASLQQCFADNDLVLAQQNTIRLKYLVKLVIDIKSKMQNVTN